MATVHDCDLAVLRREESELDGKRIAVGRHECAGGWLPRLDKNGRVAGARAIMLG